MPLRMSYGWYGPAGSATRQAGGDAYAAYAWSTLDLTGDGISDLVLTLDDPDATIGNDHWAVYEGTASGFALAPTTWILASRSGRRSSGPSWPRCR